MTWALLIDLNMGIQKPGNPLIIQNDHTILVEVDSPRHAYVRDHLMRFADLVDTSDHVHMYRFTPLSIWNACAAGIDCAHIITALRAYLKYPMPEHVTADLAHHASRYGRIELSQDENGFILKTDDAYLAEELWRCKATRSRLSTRISATSFLAEPHERGELKEDLIRIGFPAHDRAGFVQGGTLPFELRQGPAQGAEFSLRPYQTAAMQRFEQAGNGIITLPHGSGKTIIGIGCMHQVQADTLILSSTPCATQQWQTELIDKTTLTQDQIGHYPADRTALRPVTIASYETLTRRPPKTREYPHLALLSQRNWGLIIFDEIHLMTKPILQAMRPLQSCRRLGLGATLLVNRDREQAALFALIGPKISDVPWRVLENSGWMTEALCREVRIPLPAALRTPYAATQGRSKLRFASENPDKLSVLQDILARHADEQVLILGSYVAHARHIAKKLNLPLIAGSTSPEKRATLFDDFQAGRRPALVISKLANHANEIPSADVLVQISGNYGAKQIEAQHLCRILGRSHPTQYYVLVSGDTVEQDVARKRQRYLCEQGFKYRITEEQP